MIFEAEYVAAAIGGAAGVLASVIPLGIWGRRALAAAARESASIREDADARLSAVSKEMEELRLHLESLETSLRNSDEILRDDRLNQTTRARALQLLRAGITPDSAAATLGMPRLELQLLGKVSRVLGAAGVK